MMRVADRGAGRSGGGGEEEVVVVEEEVEEKERREGCFLGVLCGCG